MNEHNAITSRLNSLAGIDKPKNRNEFKNNTMYEQKRIKQENAIKAYLTKEYGENHFTDEDTERMEICENGDVHVGAAIIKTGIAIIKTGIAIE